MIREPGVDDWVIHPCTPGVSVREQVTRHVLGILRMRYPGKRGTKLAVHPTALETYGARLFEIMDNVITEVESSQMTVTLAITWGADGSPHVKQLNRRIIDPTVN